MRETTLETLATAMEDLAEGAPDHVASAHSQLTEVQTPAGPGVEQQIEQQIVDVGSLPRRSKPTEAEQRPSTPTATSAAPTVGAAVLPRVAAAPAPSDAAERSDVRSIPPERSGATGELGAEPWQPTVQNPSSTAVESAPQPTLPDAHDATFEPAPQPMLPRLPDAPAVANSTPTLARSRDLPRARVESTPSMMLPGLAWVSGRLFLTVALAGVAKLCWRGFLRGEPAMLSSELLMLAVLGVIGLAGTAWWAMSLALAARRLRRAAIRPSRLGLAWTAPVVWTVAGVFLLRVEIRAEVDPMPAIVAAGFAISLAVPYIATAGVARSLSRTRPLTHWWLTVYSIDLVTLGIAGTVLSATVVDGGERMASWQVVASALGATASVAALLITTMLAVGGPGLVRERIAMLENRQAGLSGPTWFRTGFVPLSQSSEAAAAPRPLLHLAGLRRACAAALILWSLACMAAVAAAAVAPLTGWAPPISAIAAASLAAVGGAGLWVALFGIWATAGVVNARRIRLVGSVAPSVLVVMTMPIPVGLVLAGWIGGETGWTLAMVITLAGHLLLIATCRVLGTVMSHVRGNPSRFQLLSILFTLYTGLVFCSWLTVLPISASWDDVGPIHLIAAGHALATALLAWPVHRAMSAFDRDIGAAYSGRVSYRSTPAPARGRRSLRRRGPAAMTPTVHSAGVEPMSGMLSEQLHGA